MRVVMVRTMNPNKATAIAMRKNRANRAIGSEYENEEGEEIEYPLAWRTSIPRTTL